MKKLVSLSVAALLLATACTATVAPAQAAPVSPTPITINTLSQSDVRNAYLNYFVPNMNVPSGWSGGSIDFCQPGTTTDAFRTATINTVNYYRALAGLPSVVEDGPSTILAQQAALMMDANDALSHEPASTWKCYTDDGKKGAYTSNLARTTGAWTGTDTLPLYMSDENIPSVGHRDGILFPPLGKVGIGQTTQGGALLWTPIDLRTNPPVSHGVAWPSPNYFPYENVPTENAPDSGYWSYTQKDVDFSSKTVTVTKNGVEILGISYTERTSPTKALYPHIVWQMPKKIVTEPAPGTTDIYRVTISGVGSYDVKIFSATATLTATVASVAITGTPKLGNTLTASVGTVSPTDATKAYQWYRNGAEIPGATNATYIVAAADVDQTITVKVTVSKSGYTSGNLTSTGIVGQALPASVASVAITGTPKVGNTLTASVGTVSPTDAAKTYQWYRNGAEIPGATNATYAVASADIGKTITVKVTVSKSGYTSASLTSTGIKGTAGAAHADNSSWIMTPGGPLIVGTGSESTYTAATTVRDASSNPVSGVTVTVKSAQPGVTFPAGATCTTNAAGQCSVNVYSTVAGTFDFTASLDTGQIGAAQPQTWTPDAVCAVASGCTPHSSVDAAHTTRVTVTTNNMTADGAKQDVVTAYAFDKYGNPVPNAVVTSSTADSSLTIQSGTIRTNTSGMATIWYTSTVAGNHSALVKVAGKIPANGIDDSGSVTLNFVPGGVSAANSTLAIEKDSMTVGGTVTATATTRDANKNLVPGVLVSFGKTGSASLSGTSCTTGSAGTCTVTLSDKVAETVQLSATVVAGGTATAIQASPKTVTFIAGALDPSKSSFTVAPAGPLLANGVAAYTGTFTARDSEKNLLKTLTLTDIVFGSSSSDVQVSGVMNRGDGTYTVTYKATVASNAYLATLNYGLSKIGTDQPIPFVAGTAVAEKSTLSVGPGSLGVGGNSTAKVTLRDVNNNPVGATTVNLEVTGDASLSATSCVTNNVSGSSDFGTCQVTFTDTTAETVTVTAKLSGDTIPSPTDVKFVGPGTPDPTKSSLAVSPAGPIQVDQAYSVSAVVTDVDSKPIEGASVEFLIPGDVSASASTCVTDASGTCSVTVTSTVAGSHQIGARLSDGVLSNSPIMLEFTAGQVCMASLGCVKDPSVDAAHTTRVELMVDGQPADGVSADLAVVHAFDKYGNPVSGAAVASTSAPDVAVGAIAPTSVNGKTTIQYTATVDGSYPANVTVAGGVPDGSPVTVIFIPKPLPKGTATAANSEWSMTPSGPLTVGKAAGSTYTAMVIIRDEYDQEVADALVTVASAQPGVTFPVGSTCTTNAAGECSVDVYSTVAGTFTFTASLGSDQIGVSASRAWTPGAVCSASSGCTPQASVTASQTTRITVTTNNAVADGVQHDVVTVYAFDTYGNPVPGALVLSDKVIAADVLTTQPGVIQTDLTGAATVWYASTVSGDSDAWVTVGGQIPANGVDNTGMVTLSFVPIPVPPPAAPTIDSPATGSLTNDRPVTVGGTSEADTTVEVVDQTTGATVCTVTANAVGQWTCQANLPDGDHALTASATNAAGKRSLDSSQVDVKVDTAAPGAPRIDTAGGTDVAGGPSASEPGATIEVTWPDATTGTTTVNPDGSWSILTPAGMSGEISAVAKDKAGNKSGEAKATLDILAPAAPVLNPSDGTAITGQAEPGSTMTITDGDGNPIACQEGVVTVGTDGAFRCTPLTPVTPRTSVRVAATDKAGNTSLPEEAVIFLLGLSIDSGVQESGQSQTVMGTGFVPGETVTLEFCSTTCTTVGIAIANPDGKVEITFEIPEGTPAGSHILRMTGDQSGPYLGSVEMAFEVTVQVDTGGSALASSGSVIIPVGISGLAAAILILGWTLKVIVPTSRKNKVRA